MRLTVEHSRSFSARSRRILQKTGIDVNEINPKAIGLGGGRRVYSFYNDRFVVKIPHATTFLCRPIDQLRRDTQILQTYLHDAYVPSIILGDQKTNCIVMNKIEGKHVRVSDVQENPEMQANLIRLVDANRRYIEATGNMVDFIGLSGVLSALILRNPHLGNVLHKDSQIMLIDNDILGLNGPRGISRTLSRLMLKVNTIVLEQNFGIKFRPKIPKKS